jgi:plastocyanin
MRRSSRWAASSLAGTAVVVAMIAGCFSDRAAPTAAEEGAACQVPSNVDVDGSTVVFIRGFAFHPSTVRVARGARITWVNCESTPGLAHTSSADGGAWTSPLIQPAVAFTTTMDVAGTFTYHCEPHPFMTGTVIVE